MNPVARCSFPLFAAALTLSGCSGDDPVGPGGLSSDAMPPVVVSFSPRDGWTAVEGNEPFLIVFNEAMDSESADGSVRVSTGDTLITTWVDERTLQVDHTWFRTGDWITVYLDDNLTDRAGNALATPLVWGYGIYTNNIVLHASNPADGASSVDRNTSISLQFSYAMDLASLANALTVETGPVGQKIPVGFTLAEGRYGQVIVNLASDLPPEQTITVIVEAGAAAQNGGNIASATTFSFVTGPTIDDTSPLLVGITPPNGSTIDRHTSSLRLEFSEAIDPLAFASARLSAQLAILLTVYDLEPYWSPDRTTLTIPLPTPLPAGLPILVDLDELQDSGGNVSTGGFEYRVHVEGAPVPFPFVDQSWLSYAGSGSTLQDGGSVSFLISDQLRAEQQPDGSFRFVKYDGNREEILGYEEFHRDANSIDLIAFAEEEQGVLSSPVVLSPPLELLRLPVELGSWTGSFASILDGQQVTVEYTVTVLEQVDLPSDYGLAVRSRSEFGIVKSDVVWADTWKTVLDYTIIREGNAVVAASDTTWYAPTIGRVRRASVEEDLVEDRLIRSVATVFEIDVPQ